jgi:GntR family transcriptional regulator
MRQRVSESDRRPPYVQIADDLRKQIDSGELKAHDRLPSTRALADTYGVAQMTIHHALRILKDEGRVETWQGRGSFIAEPTEDSATEEDLEARVRELTRTVRSLDERVARLEKSPEQS